MKRDWQAQWRRIAKGLLPDLLKEADVGFPNGGPMQFFFDVLPAFREAIQERNVDRIIAISEFSWWCLFQDEKDLWNSAGVAFWEHIFDDDFRQEEVIKWVPAQVVRDLSGLWQFRLGEEKAREITDLLNARTSSDHLQIRSPAQLERDLNL